MIRVPLAFALSATSAVLFVSAIAAVFSPSMHVEPWESALHFGVYGALISYAIALAFVLVRVMGEIEESLFSFLPDKDLRGVTREWLCFVLPLLAVETWLTWLPALQAAQPRKVSGQAAG
jgi:hypothetical protein